MRSFFIRKTDSGDVKYLSKEIKETPRNIVCGILLFSLFYGLDLPYCFENVPLIGNASRECLKFCFNDVIQRELDDIKKVHNTHRIRRFPNQECPSGRPDIMYSIPEYYGKLLLVYFLTVLKTCYF